MERAAILIGVNRTGDLPPLNAAASGAKRMATWAKLQGFPAEGIHLLTDDDGCGVTVGEIKGAVSSFANTRTVRQLIIYFAGHGMWSHGSEYWLLSGAPGDPNEAVNISKSQDYARIGGFEHVIFISDACRTAANERRLQIEGSSVFPNPEIPARPERSVDLFFACGFDSPATETGTPGRPETWKSVYTDVLYSCLTGDYPYVLTAEKHGELAAASVRTQKLKPFLTQQVPNALIETGGPISVPDARVTSPYEAWVSILCPPPVGFTGGAGFLKTAGQSRVREKTQALAAVTAALRDPQLLPMESMPRAEIKFNDSVGEGEFSAPPAVTRDANHIIKLNRQVPALSTGCGFYISGATLRSARKMSERAEVSDMTANTAAVTTTTAESVLLRFQNGFGAVLPAIPGFVATVTVDNGTILSVSWKRPNEPESVQIQELRAIIASLSRRGAFQLDVRSTGPESAELLARRIRDEKTTDPSMAIYAAYAFYDLNLTEKISRMAEFLTARIPVNFFDFALLTRTLRSEDRLGNPFVRRPFFPLLSRGWPLLERGDLPQGLGALLEHTVESQWTLFDKEGLDLIEDAVQQGLGSL
jgi:Caspase domain